jgi:hypothetical protein
MTEIDDNPTVPDIDDEDEGLIIVRSVYGPFVVTNFPDLGVALLEVDMRTGAQMAELVPGLDPDEYDAHRASDMGGGVWRAAARTLDAYNVPDMFPLVRETPEVRTLRFLR